MSTRIHIILATYEPNIAFLEQQVASLAAQTGVNMHLWVVIANCAPSAPLADLLDTYAPGLPYDFCTPNENVSAVGAFQMGLETALKVAGPDDLFALCDQDDIWHPEKLAKGMAALKAAKADMVHSDARVVNADGSVRHPSMFKLEGRVRRAGMRDLLGLNTITGMTTLFTRRVVETALPFPPQYGVHFYHDLWLGLVAMLYSPLLFLPEPLVDYRQHGNNAVGAVGGGNTQPNTQPARFSRAWTRQKVARYGLAQYLAKSLYLRAEEMVGTGVGQINPARLLPLKPYLGHKSIGIAFFMDAVRLAMRGRTKQAGLAAGYGLVRAGRLFWSLRRMFSGPSLNDQLVAFDTRAYQMSPGLPPQANTNGPEVEIQPGEKLQPWQIYRDARRTRRWEMDLSAPTPALVVMVPTLNPSEIFAGIATALDFGIAAAKAGHTVRFMACDLPIASHHASLNFIHNRAGSARAMKDIDLLCGVTQDSLRLHPQDRFLATAWWTAHVADELVKTLKQDQKFFYLLQDYEPNFYPWGEEFAGAEESYTFDFVPIFNTSVLRDYYAGQGHGFATKDAITFQPSIPLERYTNSPRTRTSDVCRLAVYGRPEVARNLFPTAVAALAHFLETHELEAKDIELVSVGLAHDDVALPGGAVLRSLGKIPWEDYPAFLADLDIGLSLMYSPHPSHPPLEMAAAGARVVTNAFPGKDLSRLSPLITSAAPTVSGISQALAQAYAQSKTPGTAQDRAIALDLLGAPLQVATTHLCEALDASWASLSERETS